MNMKDKKYYIDKIKEYAIMTAICLVASTLILLMLVL